MKEKHRRCCGIDVHKNSVSVCVLPVVGQPRGEVRRRKFRTYTRDLRQLRGWLKNCRGYRHRNGIDGAILAAALERLGG
jgi:transposase